MRPRSSVQTMLRTPTHRPSQGVNCLSASIASAGSRHCVCSASPRTRWQIKTAVTGSSVHPANGFRTQTRTQTSSISVYVRQRSLRVEIAC